MNHCGSEPARQDILDAVMWARQQYDVDAKHVFLLGFSGGGFVSMLMTATRGDPRNALRCCVRLVRSISEAVGV